MTYSVILHDEAQEQVATLSKSALMAYLPAHVAIAIDPWAARPYGTDPGGNMRTRDFGFASEGIVVYLINERRLRVLVVSVVWLG